VLNKPRTPLTPVIHFVNIRGFFLPIIYYVLTILLDIAMPVQYELRRLFHLMNIQTHRNSTQKALILGAYFNS